GRIAGLCAAALSAHRAGADHGARLRRVLSRARSGSGAAQPDARPAHAGGILRGYRVALRRDVRTPSALYIPLVPAQAGTPVLPQSCLALDAACAGMSGVCTTATLR